MHTLAWLVALKHHDVVTASDALSSSAEIGGIVNGGKKLPFKTILVEFLLQNNDIPICPA